MTLESKLESMATVGVSWLGLFSCPEDVNASMVQLDATLEMGYFMSISL